MRMVSLLLVLLLLCFFCTRVCVCMCVISDSRVAIGIQKETNKNTYDDRMEEERKIRIEKSRKKASAYIPSLRLPEKSLIKRNIFIILFLINIPLKVI